MSYVTVPDWSASSELLCEEAKKQGLRVEILDKKKNLFVVFDKSHTPHFFKSSAIMNNNVVGSRITDFKDLTFKVIERFIPELHLPKSITINNYEKTSDVLNAQGLHFPLVVKSLDGSHGENVFVDINDLETLEDCLQKAYAYNGNNQAIIQQMLKGDDHRIIVVGYKFVAASKRLPAFVIGDGTHTIQGLIDITNAEKSRSDNHDKPNSTIKIDDETMRLLNENDISLDTVIAAGEIIKLKRTANISTGGVAINCTHLVHPKTIELVEKIAKLLKLGLVAFDFVTPDISKELNSVGGGLIEINDTPGIKMHHFPYQGEPINVAKKIIELVVEE